jgi:hypothetical protein|tara:strand:+ start:49 stop:249 length:201 start_codon:yes stop_codon:yes gene_type:complete
MKGVRNKQSGVAGVEARVKAGFYNSDEFCREVAEVILDSDAFWRKESQAKGHRKNLTLPPPESGDG